MGLQHSANAKTLKEASNRVEDILASISEVYLQDVIETISVPRHYSADKANNERIARRILHQFEIFGFKVLWIMPVAFAAGAATGCLFSAIELYLIGKKHI